MYLKVAEVETVMEIVEITKSQRLNDFVWMIRGQSIAYDGNNFGYANSYHIIRPYDRYRFLTDLFINPSISLLTRNLSFRKWWKEARSIPACMGLTIANTTVLQKP